MAAEAPEFAAAQPEAHTPSDLLERISPHLQGWFNSTRSIVQIQEEFFGREGLISQLVHETYDFTTSKATNTVRPGLTIIQDPRATRRLREARTFNALRKFVEKGTLNPEDERVARQNFMSLMRILKSPADRDEAQRLLSQRPQELHDIYRNRVQSPEEELASSAADIKDEIASYLEQNFDHILELAQFIEENPNALIALLQFLKKEDAQSLDWARTSMQRELQRPNPTKTMAFFDEMGKTYFQGGRNDPVWEAIELALPYNHEELLALYTNSTDPEGRKQTIFGQIAKALENGKSMPPIVRERFSAFLKKLQDDAISKIKTLAQSVSLPQFKDSQPQDFDIETKKRHSAGKAPKGQEEPESPEVPKTTKQILIDGVICDSEQSIKENLRGLFMRETIPFIANDLVIYTLVIAKRAGIRDNAPPHIYKKPTGFKKVQFSNGDSADPMILRRSTKSSPRVIIAETGDYVAIVNVTNRDNHVYDKMLERGFHSIQLPS